MPEQEIGRLHLDFSWPGATLFITVIVSAGVWQVARWGVAIVEWAVRRYGGGDGR